MANDVKIELQLDGEKQFNQALKSCNAELKNMQTQVKATDAANKGAANTQEALTKKVEALGKASESAGKKVETMEKIVEKQKKAQQDAAKALDEAKQKYGEGSKEVEKAQTAYNNATNSVNKWETELNKAKVEQSNINSELEKNERYLDEAKQSTDGVTKSLDEYGKETKDADKDTEDLQKTMAKTGAAEAMQKVCDILSNTIGRLGEAALDAAKDLDKGYDTIVKKTGAAGDSLDEFKDIANDIFGDMPEDMETVGKAVGEVNTRFKQSGDQLQKTSTQFLKFARINDTDVSDAIDDVQVAMAAFNVDVRESNKVLDVLTRTGQNTGAKVGQLASKVTQNATAFQQLGMDVYQAIDFMGRLEVAGADAESVLSGMKRALKNATDQGKPFNEALAEMENSVKNGASDMEGLNAAYDLFGRSGAAIFQAVKNGQISFTELADSTGILEDATDSLNEAYENTLSGWDAMTTAQNKLKTIGSELMDSFFNAAAPAVNALNGFLEDLLDTFQSLPDEVQTVIGVIAGVGSIAAQVVPQIMNFVTQLATLEVMKKLSGDAKGLTGSLGKLKSGLGAATAVAAGVAAGLAMVSEASKQLSKDFTEFATKTEGLKSGYDTTRDSVRDLQETIGTYTTAQEKREAIEAKIAEVEETQRQAQRNYNDEVKDGKMANDALAESMLGELDPLSELLNGLSNGAVRNMALSDSVKATQETFDNTNETLESTSEDLETLNQMLADVEAEEKAAAETVTNAEGQIVQARDASISKAGEELTAYSNLSTGQQELAQKVAEAVTAVSEGVRSSLESQMNMFEQFSANEAIATDQMLANMQSQIDGVRNWEQNLTTLAARGVDEGMLAKLAEMGPQGSGYVQTFVNMSDEELKKANDLWGQSVDMKNMTDKWGQDLINGVGTLAAGGEEALAGLGEALNAKTNEVGQYEVAGLVDGINAAMEQATEAANQLGEQSVKAVATGAQTQSPSKATLETGRNIDQGLINGMNQLKNQAASKGREVAQAIISTIRSVNAPSQAKSVGSEVSKGLATGITAQKAVAVAAASALVSTTAQALSSKAQILYNAAISVMKSLQRGMTEGASSAKTAGNTAGQNIASSIASGINANAGTATSAAASLASSVSSNAAAVSTGGAYTAGYSLASGMASGILAGQSLAIAAAAQMAANALQAAKNKLQIKSPSKVFEDEVGKMAALGFAEGFNQEINIDTGKMLNTISNGLPDMSQYTASPPPVYVYLGDRELTAVMSQGVVKNITGGVRAYGAAGGKHV